MGQSVCTSLRCALPALLCTGGTYATSFLMMAASQAQLRSPDPMQQPAQTQQLPGPEKLCPVQALLVWVLAVCQKRCL